MKTMFKICCSISMLFLVSCKTATYYVVRHAEKETNSMTNDMPLTAQGQQRAEALKDLLINQKMRFIYSTNYIRTKSTAQPLANAEGISIQMYSAADSSFIPEMKKTTAGNILIVGHSNTVDNLVNQITGKTIIPRDLPETEYGDLFVIKRKGRKYNFEKRHFGK